jgi:hypothetical protein
MSARISLLRDAVQDLLNWPREPAVADKARAALAATAFVAPETFPFDVGTRSGAIVTLHGIRDGRLIGSWVDRDGLQLNDWYLDGTLFGADDPDDFDLILPEDLPLFPAVAA